MHKLYNIINFFTLNQRLNFNVVSPDEKWIQKIFDDLSFSMAEEEITTENISILNSDGEYSSSFWDTQKYLRETLENICFESEYTKENMNTYILEFFPKARKKDFLEILKKYIKYRTEEN